MEYVSPYRSVQTVGELKKQIHLNDYDSFVATITNADRYRLQNRIPETCEYPIPRPHAPPFPSGIKELEPRVTTLIRPQRNWYDFVLVWRLLAYADNLAAFRKHEEEVDAYNRWLTELLEDRRLYWRHKKEMFEAACAEVHDEWDNARLQYETQVREDQEHLHQLHAAYQSGEGEAVKSYFSAHLNSLPLPRWCPLNYELEYDANEDILVVDLNLPNLSALEVVKSGGLRGGTRLVPANQTERRQFANRFLCLFPLRVLWEIGQVDDHGQVALVYCNGHMIRDDPATGHRRDDVILSVGAGHAALLEIRLDRVDPEACFRRLKGRAAPRISDLVPVQPIIRFDTKDHRFIEPRDVLDGVGDSNLATMDWQDFEHLVRELLEREYGSRGAEVKITPASRDHGIDAIVFDPDPMTGGKIVIQAKRYINTVDVSAVRDLYGTVENEGANKGILVTTSSYGREAREFELANQYRIQLWDGNNLLALLRKHGYQVRIDIEAAKELLRTREPT